jgi:hypothetical protein
MKTQKSFTYLICIDKCVLLCHSQWRFYHIVFNFVTSLSVEIKSGMQQLFSVDSFISQFTRLDIVFKCYKVLRSTDM